MRQTLGDVATGSGGRACWPAVCTVLAGIALAPEASAHDDSHGLAWRTTPYVLLALAVMALVYASGVQTLWRRAGIGKGLRRWQVVCFGIGWFVLVLALVSPVDALADELATAHMVQHLALMLVAAPLIILGSPGLAALWALPTRWRVPLARRWKRTPSVSSAWTALSQPVLVWLIYFIVLWGWHVPSLYEAALANRLLHDVQHILFFGAASLGWWVVLSPMGGVRLTGGEGVLYLFTTSLHAMALGVFMTLSPGAWYPSYDQTAAAWGLEAVQDQQIAGAIMWMPAALAYVVLAGLIFWLWMRQTEVSASRLERAWEPAQRDATDLLAADGGETARR